MKNIAKSLVVMTALALGSHASAAVGVNVALGLPYVQQAGLNVQLSNYFGVSVGYNLLDLSSLGAKLSMPEALVQYHPFGGSFYIAGGIGQETLNVTLKDTNTNSDVKVDSKATTTIAKVGWMWGAANGGFWFGMDASYIMPSGATLDITAPGVPTTSQEYQDAVENAKKYAETAYTNITFARFGWLF